MTRSQQSAGEAALSTLRRLPRPAWPDVLAAVLVVYVGMISLANPVVTPDIVIGGSTRVGEGVFVALVAVCAVSTLLRRRLPTAGVVATCLVCLVHLVCYSSLSFLVVVAGLMAVETTTSRVPRPWAWVLLAGQAAGAAAGTLLVSYRASGLAMEPARAGVIVSVALVFMTAAALAGLLRRRTRERRDQVRERLELLWAQRETERRLAVVQERNRIARDVHDLVGHCLSVVAMQAEGARAVLATSPAEAERALVVIGETSRRAVDDVRALVDVLRSDDAVSVPSAAAGAAAPSDRPVADEPGMEQLVGLVAGVREVGTALTLRLTVSAAVPSPVGACVYRVVQEALTNAVSHAPGAAVEVGIEVTGGRLDLMVSNAASDTAASGLAAATGVADTASADGARRTGLGLVSMSERVHALGGTLTAGALPEGGWRVHAVFPLAGGEA